MKKLLPVILLLTPVMACSRPVREQLIPPTTGQGSTSAFQTGSFEGQFETNGVRRHYLVHVPINYRPGTQSALVLNFHGLGSNSQEEENLSGMSDKAEQEGFIVIYPDGIDARWNTGPGVDGQGDMQFLRELVDTIKSQYNIDPKRIYATGISNGGGMTNRLACEAADLIAAIAPVAGGYNFWEDCQPSRPVPVLAFHGLDDNIIPYMGGQPPSMAPPIQDWAAAWAARNGCLTESEITNAEEQVIVNSWSDCQADADVILYALGGHGHSWPGSPSMPRAITSQVVNATNTMWDFFKMHPIP